MNNILVNNEARDEFKKELLEFEKDLIVSNSQIDASVAVNKLSQKLEELEKKYENK